MGNTCCKNTEESQESSRGFYPGNKHRRYQNYHQYKPNKNDIHNPRCSGAHCESPDNVKINVNNMMIYCGQAQMGRNGKEETSPEKSPSILDKCKEKYRPNSISCVKEVDESKEVSRKEDNTFSKINRDLSNKSIYENMVRKGNFKIEDKYDFKEPLGKGGFGRVIKAILKDGGHIRACKIQSKKNFSKKALTMVKNEIEILKIADHPNIIKIFEFTEDEEDLNIFMELCEGGEIFEYICKKGTFSEGMACKIIKQVLSALAYLHSKNIIHSDLKAENIMFFEKDAKDLHVKLIDFGMATKFNPKEKLSQVQGTPYYLAPEILKGKYDEKADIWSCGVLLYIMLSGGPPFRGKSLKEVFISILTHELTFELKKWDHISEMSKNFIRKLLEFKPSDRPTAQDCLKMAWVKRFSKNKECGTNVISKSVLKNLQRFNCERKFQQAILAYIANYLTPARNNKKLRETFLKLDEDHDGVLKKNDLKCLIPKQILSAMDLNNDGVIDYTEFVAAATDVKTTLTEANLKHSFKQFDVNGEGYIDIENLKKILGVVEAEDDLVDILQLVEIGDEKRINYTEFKKIMMMLIRNHSKSISDLGKKKSSILDLGFLMQAQCVSKDFNFP
ncbi:unnamed protein product [Moneuplotes crassus]|uniref:non-specific serine/threonine protein kinase n=1 Tax=Euplotes crassus TaxID=5936 RepID=A0AAD1U4I8_EUPCR|nr:unnamed protein product [Moneuplotes crassus]